MTRATDTLDESSRRDYLRAMGIAVWLPRHEAAADSEASPTVGQASAGADDALTNAGAASRIAVSVDLAPPGDGAGPSVQGVDARSSSAADNAAPATVAAADGSHGRATADQWALLAHEVSRCTRCRLHETRTQPVFGTGDRKAKLMIIGEAPGAEEDRSGEPFVGRAGQLLTAMLDAIGFSREQVFIANTLKCRPPQNRDPRSDEMAACSDYLERQIAGIAPAVILAVGRIAAQQLLRQDLPLGRLRGTTHALAERGTPVVVTYHPAYLLRTPAQKALAWQDLKRVRRLLGDAA